MEGMPNKGLSDNEVAARLKQEGYNELPSSKPRTIFTIALDVLKEPMFLLLAISGLIYLILGDLSEALFLLASMLVVIAITLYQENKTERALEALRDLSSPRALVIRNGIQKRIPGREVVREDTLILSEGDRVAADAILLTCNNILVDESLLTGESVPVRKRAWIQDDGQGVKRPGGDDLPNVYSGTLIVQGQAIGRVQATGGNTELGKIGKSLQTLQPEQTRLHRETGLIVRILSIVGIFLCTAVVVLYGLTRGSWLNGLLAGLTLAMSIIPEEFPVVLTVFLALGAWRISQKNVLTRRISAIETLGSATVLCVDKTGTLTSNRMAVSQLETDGELHLLDDETAPLPEKFHEISKFSILASAKDPFDPMEKAILKLKDFLPVQYVHEDWNLVHEYALSVKLLAVTRVWQLPATQKFMVAAKGAPEAIADLCHLDTREKEEVTRSVDSMAAKGLRVLGVAKAEFHASALPDAPQGFEFQFLGLLGLGDPVRPSVPGAVKECYAAGVRVAMITGDYPETARAIARQIGLRAADSVITGSDLERLSEKELERQIGSVNIFARVLPEQKLRLVNALKANGAIVAMTGDGVNDAPALKSAHIGIAMGGRGTDVAREASSLVLVHDDFASIVDAIRMGRRIFDNLRKAISYILAVHVPIAGMSLIPLLLKWPLLFSPVHILFLELIIDPACSIAFEAEPEESKIMNRPPRSPVERLFSTKTITISLLQGFIVLAIIMSVFGISLYLGLGELDARALAFTTLVVANISLIFTNRSWTRTILATSEWRNTAIWWVAASTFALLFLVLYVPFFRNLFRFSTLHFVDLLVSLAAGVTSVLWFEGLKILRVQLK